MGSGKWRSASVKFAEALMYAGSTLWTNYQIISPVTISAGGEAISFSDSMIQNISIGQASVIGDINTALAKSLADPTLKSLVLEQHPQMALELTL